MASMPRAHSLEHLLAVLLERPLGDDLQCSPLVRRLLDNLLDDGKGPLTEDGGQDIVLLGQWSWQYRRTIALRLWAEDPISSSSSRLYAVFAPTHILEPPSKRMMQLILQLLPNHLDSLPALTSDVTTLSSQQLTEAL